MTEAANEFVTKMIDRSVFTPNELALCNRIQELEDALAQTQNSLTIEQDAFRNMQLQRDALKAQVEQLERQVAELTATVPKP